jgi:hypothetical protein
MMYCKKKTMSKVTAYNLSEGHYDSERALLFDCYQDGIPTIIINEKNSHKAFQDSFVVNDGKHRWFVQTDVFYKSYQKISGNQYESLPLVKNAYDLSLSHYDNDSNLLFESYTSVGNPILTTLESEHYVCDKDGFIIIGVMGEKYHCSREYFFENYDLVLM